MNYLSIKHVLLLLLLLCINNNHSLVVYCFPQFNSTLLFLLEYLVIHSHMVYIVCVLSKLYPSFVCSLMCT